MRRSAATVATAAATTLSIAAATAAMRLRRYEIVDHSMTPSLRAGDYTLAVRLGTPRRGDVVVFQHADRPGFELVKRIIGLPNETIEIVNGLVRVDGHVLEEPWASEATIGMGRWELDGRSVFVLGDARTLSSGDSRATGPIPLRACRYRIAFIYWPPSRLGSRTLRALKPMGIPAETPSHRRPGEQPRA